MGRTKPSVIHIRRRQVVIVASALLATPLRGLAQRATGPMRRIGFLGVGAPAAWGPRLEAFRAGLRDLGYVEGKNIAIEFRFAEGRYERLPSLAAELVRLNVEVIVTHSVPGVLAAKEATATSGVPIVMTNVGDAIERGVIASLARPGGNITGDTFLAPELAAKRLDVLKEAIPHLGRVATLVNPDNLSVARLLAMDDVAKARNIALLRFDVRSPDELDRTFTSMAKERVDALAVNEDVVFIPSVKRIAALALKHRLPSIGFIEYAEGGGLFGYGVNFLALYRRAPVFVDKILRGAKPADIPVERPTAFEFAINKKTAAALGTVISSAARLRADRLIE